MDAYSNSKENYEKLAQDELYGAPLELSIARLLAILIGKGTITGEDILLLKGTFGGAECKK